MINWKYYKYVDFSDENIAIYNIDTRDFYCLVQTKAEMEEHHRLISTLDTTKIDKYRVDKYYHTEQEVKDLIERFWRESGGDGDWRMLSLKSKNKNVTNWNLKYIRIARTEKGLLVCNSYGAIISKNDLSDPIEQEYLNHIADKMYKR
jgi:hypothetical protein